MKIKLSIPVAKKHNSTQSVYKRIDDAHTWEEFYDKGSPDEHPDLEEYYRNKFFNTYKNFLQPDEYFESYRTTVHHESRNGGILRGCTYLRICSKKNPFYESEMRFGDHWNGDLPENCGSYKLDSPLGKGAGRITTLKTQGDNFKSDPNKIVEVGRRVFHTEHYKDAREIESRGWQRLSKILDSDKNVKYVRKQTPNKILVGTVDNTKNKSVKSTSNNNITLTRNNMTHGVKSTGKGTVHLPPKKSPVPLMRPTPPTRK